MLEDKTEKIEKKATKKRLEVKREVISWNKAYDIAYAALINQAVGRLWDHWGENFEMGIMGICDQAHKIANRTVLKERWTFEKEQERDEWL